MSRNSKIYIAGHKGLVGSAILRKLKLKGYSKIITADRKNNKKLMIYITCTLKINTYMRLEDK